MEAACPLFDVSLSWEKVLDLMESRKVRSPPTTLSVTLQILFSSHPRSTVFTENTRQLQLRNSCISSDSIKMLQKKKSLHKNKRGQQGRFKEQQINKSVIKFCSVKPSCALPCENQEQ